MPRPFFVINIQFLINSLN